MDQRLTEKGNFAIDRGWNTMMRIERTSKHPKTTSKVMAHQSASNISVVYNVSVPEKNKHHTRYIVTIAVTIADVRAIGSRSLFPLKSCLKITFGVILIELSSECFTSSSVTSNLCRL